MIGSLLLAAALLPGAGVGNAAPLEAAGATVTARLAPERITVGDPVQVEIEVALPPDALATPPVLPAGLRHWGDAEVLATRAPQRLPGNAAVPRWRLGLVLTAFRTGEINLPPLPLAISPGNVEAGRGLRLHTPENLGFTVTSVLAKADATPLPPAPPRPLRIGAAFWWTAAALALACIAAAVALARRPRGVGAGAATPPLTALARFLHEVAPLDAEPSSERLHTALSLAMRRLLATLAGIAAVERTTTEIDRELRRTRVEPGARRRVLELLRQCDEVKFARRPAPHAEAQGRLEAARELAAELDRALAPVVELPGPATQEAAA